MVGIVLLGLLRKSRVVRLLVGVLGLRSEWLLGRVLTVLIEGRLLGCELGRVLIRLLVLLGRILRRVLRRVLRGILRLLVESRLRTHSLGRVGLLGRVEWLLGRLLGWVLDGWLWLLDWLGRGGLSGLIECEWLRWRLWGCLY